MFDISKETVQDVCKECIANLSSCIEKSFGDIHISSNFSAVILILDVSSWLKTEKILLVYGKEIIEKLCSHYEVFPEKNDFEVDSFK